MLVTRTDIAAHVHGAFAYPPATKDGLLAEATRTQAHPQLICVLQSLPDREYQRLRDLWTHLPQIPVS